MQNKHTELLHKESVRLLGQQIALLKNIQATDGLLKEPNPEQKQSLDVVRVQQDIEVLEGELGKLENLEMVIAIVGTMKSGKSTTNNAIVGLEVLPNRNRPMTALPTLIRHVTGQKKPILRFDNNQALNVVVEAIKRKLNTDEGAQLLAVADQREDLEKVAKVVQNGFEISYQYENESGIFEFLKGLNDLVRLATALDLDFPFDEFRTMTELPVIEVEFQHLRGGENAGGRLSILDTPGPNEEGQFALKAMMKEQLRRASGVIAVLDYTQLKSESDAEVRRELLEIAEMADGRLSVWVNKFDQKDRNSDGEGEVKSLVANELLKGKIGEEDVYPVSSRYAYLANRARTELTLHATLPEPSQHPWVADFAEEGLGRRWADQIGNVEKVNDAIEDLWADSLFEKPLARVIKNAHTHAAILAINSVASKLVDIGARINNYLGVRETALQRSAEELRSYIASLQKQQEKVGQLEDSFKEQLDGFTDSLKKQLKDLTVLASKKLDDSLENYFSYGRGVAHAEASSFYREQMAIVAKSIGPLKKFLGDFIGDGFEKPKIEKLRKPDFDQNSTKIEFREKKSAKDLVEKINCSINQEYMHVNELMLAAMNEVHGLIEKESSDLERKAKSILDELSSNLKKQGFDLKLNLPTRRALVIEINNQKILDDMVANKTRTVTRHRRQSGAWGTVCGWFGTDDWGWESYKDTEDFYLVDINKIKSAVFESSKNIFNNAEAAIQNNILTPVEISCGEFFVTLKEVIDEVRGDLLQGLNDGDRSKQEQEDLARKLSILRQDFFDSDGDCTHLKNDSKSALAEEQLCQSKNVPSLESEL